MWDTTIAKIIFGILIIAVVGSMIMRGAPLAAVGFIAFLLLPYGFGRILYSKDPASDWIAWTSLAAGVAIALYLKSSVVVTYAGIVILGQILGKCLGWFFPSKSDDG